MSATETPIQATTTVTIETRHYTPKEAAKLLTISEAQVYRLIAANAIRTVGFSMPASKKQMRRIPYAEMVRLLEHGVSTADTHPTA